MAIQLNIFEPTVIRTAYLVAKSPRAAFYRIWLEFEDGQYVIRKESGCGAKVLDRRRWAFPDFAKAERVFNRKVREKTNPARKSPRRYVLKRQ